MRCVKGLEMSGTGWPDPTMPGYPLMDDVSHWHWLRAYGFSFPAYWDAQKHGWYECVRDMETGSATPPHGMAGREYLGPLRPPPA
jgi:hypothetical protein